MMSTTLLNHITNYFGLDVLNWFDASYIGDWALTTLLWFISDLIDHFNVFEREFSVDDPLISHPHTKQQISGYTNNAIAIFLPLSIMALASFKRRSLVELHHGALGLWLSRSLSHFTTEVIKNRVGRLRPDFLARCKWSEALSQCTGKTNTIMDGRKSFPSGHSAAAFTGMTFLFLWLSARTAAWTFGVALPVRKPWIFTSRVGRILVTLLPLIFATWVAISRLEDYRHHKEDIIVGSLIGISCALAGYLLYWPNPFSHQHHTHGIACEPRLLYRNESDIAGPRNTTDHDGYELARLEEGS